MQGKASVVDCGHFVTCADVLACVFPVSAFFSILSFV